MKELARLCDSSFNMYEYEAKSPNRTAVRAIIFIQDQLLLIKSSLYGEYKFPGGKVEANEDFIDALKREVLEESGYQLVDGSIKELGYVLEIRENLKDHLQAYVMKSCYYYAKVGDEVYQTNYQGYEISYGYYPCLVHLDDAIQCNEQLMEKGVHENIRWVERELLILKLLKQ